MGSVDLDEIEAERVYDVEETIFIAVGKNVKKSRTTLFWALHSFAGKKICLLHVHRPPNVVSFTDSRLPVNNRKEDAVKAFQVHQRKKLEEILFQYCLILGREGVQADKVWIEMGNIEKGIVEIISRYNIRWLVMGAAADKYYTKKLSELKSMKAMFVCQQAPTFCHIWFVCKGSLIYTRDGRNESEAGISLPLLLPTKGSETQQSEYLISQPVTHKCTSQDVEQDADELLEELNCLCLVHSSQSGNTLPRTSKLMALVMDEEEKIEEKTIEKTSPSGKAIMDVEDSKQKLCTVRVKRWKEEDNVMEAKCKAKALESLCVKEMKLRKEMEEAFAREKQDVEKTRHRCDESMKELQLAKQQKSLLENQLAEANLMMNELEEKIILAVDLLISFKEKRDAARKEYENAVREVSTLGRIKMDATSFCGSEILEFSFLEINEATHNFDPSRKIGEGKYGSIYKGFLHHAHVAIKMLPSYGSQSQLEFQNGVEVLSRVRHPNLVTLIGTCPESRSLVYEFARNGSLEDYLACRGKTCPLTWQTRTNIAFQICSALIFLHSNKPCIIHGNLKPSKVLLDANCVSKLSDFGILHLIPQGKIMSNIVQTCSTRSPNYISSYIDPEYLESGMLTAESDVYSFGIVLLQLLTGRPVLGMVKDVRSALEKENLRAVLDCSSGEWPLEQAKQLADLALRCCEKNRFDRPDLASEIWGLLGRVKASVNDSDSCLGPKEPLRIPSHFLCPIFQEVMKDPQIASDGFTYEAEAIRGWLKCGHNTSPMTNLKLEHCNLLPNHALHQAIQEWRQHW